MARISMIVAVGVASVLAATPSVAKDRSKDKPDPYVASGQPVDCIPISQIRSTNVRDDRTIDFQMNGRRIYRNMLPNSCPSLGFEKRFSYATSLSQLCSVDIIRVLWNQGGALQSGASCGLGKFQPMERPAR
ncbi:MAG: hypothetical protein DI606_05970 [Sphingobium sp.]|jgi:hypothetical protein|uniref:hypothetical protein n=1 Tax=Sphingobium sp. TaxID=1912891 RepID=UPI000DB066FF|nr:hypothetical protein [Sphingobium sp.]PZU13395.1 MAG: hypothetical protein DI606_05970 [Sphingobium sp.]